MASVIGRDFPLDVLQRVARIPEQRVFESLDEAVKAAVVEERGGMGAGVSYRFAHAFFRQMLYEDMIAPRRMRLHQQVGRVLERVFKEHVDDRANELAEHFSQSYGPADLEKAVYYSEMAARRAIEVYAYGGAVQLLEPSNQAAEVDRAAEQGKAVRSASGSL